MLWIAKRGYIRDSQRAKGKGHGERRISGVSDDIRVFANCSERAQGYQGHGPRGR